MEFRREYFAEEASRASVISFPVGWPNTVLPSGCPGGDVDAAPRGRDARRRAPRGAVVGAAPPAARAPARGEDAPRCRSARTPAARGGANARRRRSRGRGTRGGASR